MTQDTRLEYWAMIKTVSKVVHSFTATANEPASCCSAGAESWCLTQKGMFLPLRNFWHNKRIRGMYRVAMY